MSQHPGITANQLNLPFYVHKLKNVFLELGTREVKFVSEQLASYKHHILSEKRLAKASCLDVQVHPPFTSQSRLHRRLYCINYVARSIHPSNGHAF